MVAAARYGRVFRCDPMGFLDRPSEDLPVLLALVKVAHDDMRREQSEAERRQR